MADGLTIKELITKWGFQVDDKSLDALDRKLDNLKSSVKVVGGLAIGAAGAIFGMAKSAANAGDEAKKAAERLGISVEAFQEYAYAADLAGIESGAFQGSLRKMIVTLGDARNGSQAAKDQLKAMSKVMGYDVVKSGKPAEDLLVDMADAFAGMTDSTKKAAIAQDVFGREGGRMINLLNQGGDSLRRQREEARALGVVMSAETAAAAEEFNDSLTRAHYAVKGLRNVVAVGLFPVLTKLANRFTQYVVANRALLKLKVDKAIELMTNYLERALWTLERMVRVVNSLVKLFGGWEKVIGFVTTAIVVLMGLRFVAFLGSLIQVLGKAVFAMRLLGQAGLLAQLQMAAVPLAIGAAFIALLLIIEDVVAYFQGRKSMTGLILNNFEELEGKLTEWIDSILTKVKEFGRGLGKAIVDGIEALQDADWKKIGDFLLKALKLALDLGTIPFQIGMAIAAGIMEGLEANLKGKHPWLHGLLFGQDNQAKDAVMTPAPDAKGNVSTLDRVAASFMNMGQGESLTGIALEKIGGLIGGAATMAGKVATSPALNGASLPDLGGRQYGGQPINVTSPINVTVPAGTPPEAVGPYVRDGIKDGLDSVLRETARAGKPAVAY
jgi:hypothetical protein